MHSVKEALEFTLLQFGKFHLQVGNLVSVAIILFIARFFSYLIQKGLNRRVKSGGLDKGSSFAIMQIAKYLIWTFAFISCIQAAGIDISFILAGSAALLVGIGLGLQQTFKDFFAGIVLLIEGVIKVGDVIEFEGMVCTVHKIGLRTATVITHDEAMIIVPNSKFTSESVINWTHSQKIARFHVEVGISYDTNEELVKKTLLGCLDASEKKAGEPSVHISSFEPSFVLYKLSFWSHDIFHASIVKSEIRFRILREFRDQKIKIPYPQMEVNISSQNNSPTLTQ